MNGWPTFRSLVGYILQFGLIVLVAGYIAEAAHFSSDMSRSMLGAMIALTINELVPVISAKAKKFIQKWMS